MFEIKITDKNLLSHLYISDLVYQQDLRDFTLDGDILCSPKTVIGAQISAAEFIISDVQSDHRKLVIFTEGLHFEQLMP